MPKTYKHLYPRICAFGNLYLAHRKARRGGKRRNPEVAEFEHNLGENLLQLQEELRARTYRPAPYHNFIFVERKERKISAARYRDRVVHHALMNVIDPIFEARFIHDTYANRVGKGTETGTTTGGFVASARLQEVNAKVQRAHGRTERQNHEERFRPHVLVALEAEIPQAGRIRRCPGRASRPVVSLPDDWPAVRPGPDAGYPASRSSWGKIRITEPLKGMSPLS